MKLWKRILDQTVRYIVSISDGQFGFKSRLGTTDTICVFRTQGKMYRQSNMPLDMVFVDLEKHMTPYLEKCYRDARGNGISRKPM